MGLLRTSFYSSLLSLFRFQSPTNHTQYRDFFSNSIIKDSVGALNSIIECKMSFPGRAVQRAWHVVDASSQTVGRLATTVAPLLKGKHKPTYRPNKDCGDYVVIVNAEKVSTLY